MNLTSPHLPNKDHGIDYQVIIDFLGNTIVDDKNFQFLTTDERKLEFIQKFLQQTSKKS